MPYIDRKTFIFILYTFLINLNDIDFHHALPQSLDELRALYHSSTLAASNHRCHHQTNNTCKRKTFCHSSDTNSYAGFDVDPQYSVHYGHSAIRNFRKSYGSYTYSSFHLFSFFYLSYTAKANHFLPTEVQEVALGVVKVPMVFHHVLPQSLDEFRASCHSSHQ